MVSTTAIRVDSVSGRPPMVVYALSAAAGLLLLYALFEVIRAQRVKALPEAADEENAEPIAEDVDEAAEEMAEETAEEETDAAECEEDSHDEA